MTAVREVTVLNEVPVVTVLPEVTEMKVVTVFHIKKNNSVVERTQLLRKLISTKIA